MKRGLLAAVALAVALHAVAQPATLDATVTTRFAEGVAAYEAGRAAEAEAAFEGLVREGHAHPDVLFNLGNAAYRQGKWPRAVLAYEWALQLDPGDAQARENLALARAKLVVDEVPLDVSPEAQRVLAALGRVPVAWTAILFVATWTAGWALLAVRLAKSAAWATWPGVLALLVALVFGTHVAWREMERRGPPQGVLQAAEVDVRSGPGESYETLFTLHAGTLVEEHETRGDWSRVRIPHGPSGWIERDTVVLMRVDQAMATRGR